MKRIKDYLSGQPQEDVVVKGWVRTKRGNKNVAFIALNDGSTINNIQVVCDPSKFDEALMKQITTGACLCVKGDLVPSMGSGQAVEVQAKEIEVYGTADPESYPLQKKGHSMEFLREIAHLRPRTNTFGAVFRMRHAMAFAIHKFFNDKGFCYLHTPLITASDCEGAGEMFQVTTLDLENLPRTDDGAVDYSQDFFGRQTALTVSGQLEGELGAMALGNIYTFGPTFRAENSNTPRHLAEFWMIEPEMAFYDVNDLMDLEEEFIKYLVQYALDNCQDDLAFLNKIPIIGPMLNDQSLFIYLTWFIAIAAWLFVYKTPYGFWLRASGEKPDTLRTAGISPKRMKWIASVICGILCALAGAHLSLGHLSGTFAENMSSNRGFIAFACVIFAAANPSKAYLAALMFGFFEAIGLRLQGYVSSDLTSMIPYIITIIMMVYVVVRKQQRKKKLAKQEA